MHDVLGQLAVGEHYQPNMQDTVTLLCRFMDIPTKVGASHHHLCSSTSACIILQQLCLTEVTPQHLFCSSSSACNFHQQLARFQSTPPQHKLCESSSAWSTPQQHVRHAAHIHSTTSVKAPLPGSLSSNLPCVDTLKVLAARAVPVGLAGGAPGLGWVLSGHEGKQPRLGTLPLQGLGIQQFSTEHMPA